jgi:hypothetical protein
MGDGRSRPPLRVGLSDTMQATRRRDCVATVKHGFSTNEIGSEILWKRKLQSGNIIEVGFLSFIGR